MRMFFAMMYKIRKNFCLKNDLRGIFFYVYQGIEKIAPNFFLTYI
jgi:hypothetical protein